MHRQSLPQEKSLVLTFRGWIDLTAQGSLGGSHRKKSPVTPPGIDPGTVRLVAQCICLTTEERARKNLSYKICVTVEYDIFVNCNWVVTRWQYTFTHKQYIEQYKTTIHTTTQQFWKIAGRAPSWLVLHWHLPYNRGKSTEKPQSG